MTFPASTERFTDPVGRRRGSVVARLRDYGMPPRILGIDIARGLAVLGMFGAHVGYTEDFDWAEPGTWLDLVNGRSAILFAVLAGVSIAIISGRMQPVTGDALVRARVRILTRAVLIFALGGLLEYLGTGVAVILPTYALLFVLALPFLQWRPVWLFVLAGIVAIAAPVFNAVIYETALAGSDAAIIELFVTGSYPGMIWIAFVLAGLGVGRLDLASPRLRTQLLGVGAGLMAVGYGLGAVVASAFGQRGSAASGFDPGTPAGGIPAPDLTVLASIDPHSGSPFEVIGSTGFALVVIALCLLAARTLRWVLFPIAAVGAMALTAYSVHILAIAAIGVDLWEIDDNGLYLVFTLVALAACSVWAILVGRGPLEQLLTVVSTRAATFTPALAGRLDRGTPPEEKSNT